MHDDHYGLSGRPFQLTPDPQFWYDTATHRKAMAYLGYGLSQGEVARRCGISVKTVEKHLATALAALCDKAGIWDAGAST